MASRSPRLKSPGANMKLSCVAAEVNLMSEATPSSARIILCTLMPPFFCPFFGLRPTPLKMRLENRGMVVESSIRRLPNQGGMEPLRLSAESRWRFEASKSR